MGARDRLLRLKAHAEARGPIEDVQSKRGDGELEFDAAPVFVPTLEAVDPSVIEDESPEALAASSNGCAGLDCETFLIQPGRNTPRLVVTGYQSASGHRVVVGGNASDPTVHARAFCAFADAILANADGKTHTKLGNVLINQNIPFDFATIAEDAHQTDVTLGLVGKDGSFFEAVMQRIFAMLDRGMVEDTILRERLIDLAEGTLGKDHASLTDAGNPRRKRYTLAALSKKYLGVDLDKFTWRTGYHSKLNKDLSEYEDGALKYVVDDVSKALQVAARQQLRAQLHGLPVGSRIPNSAEQTKAAWSFQLISSWGVRTDRSKVQKLDAELDHWSGRFINVLKDTGLIRKDGKDEGTRDTKLAQKLVLEAYKKEGLPVPMSESGMNVSLSGAVLEDITLIRLRGNSREERLNADGQLDEEELFKEPLYAYSQYTSIQKLKNTYIPVLYSGVDYPINARFETILESGRASSYKPNLMNLPRGGFKTMLQRLQARVRQCFVPRPGFLYCSVDYNMLELCTLAQICIWMLGHSRLAEEINKGFDVHTLMAAEQFLNIPYDEAMKKRKAKDKFVDDMRQLVKALNFGLPGGLGAASFVKFAKATYNVYVTEEEARELKQKWLAMWPEMRAYFRMIAALMRGVDEKGQTIGDIEQYVSGRIRGRTRYTAACNTFFQGLAADGAKSALYDLQKACYLRNGALYGSRCVAFVHDEVIMEHPEHLAAERALIQADMMIKSMQLVCPDVRVSAEPALMRCWYKDASPVFDGHGKLIPWEPPHTLPKKLSA